MRYNNSDKNLKVYNDFLHFKRIFSSCETHEQYISCSNWFNQLKSKWEYILNNQTHECSVREIIEIGINNKNVFNLIYSEYDIINNELKQKFGVILWTMNTLIMKYSKMIVVFLILNNI